MRMNSKIISSIKSRLKKVLSDKDVLDVLLFGSSVKGKASPHDIDIAIITKNPHIKKPEGFHVSLLKPEDFFLQPPTLVNTLLREGYSLKHGKFLSERYQFSTKVLFIYEVASLQPSEKVKVVTILRGTKKIKGMVEEHEGQWLANQVFLIPIRFEHLFREFFINFHVSFKQYFTLIH